jgi:M6 family metalloprotease-like protein
MRSSRKQKKQERSIKSKYHYIFTKEEKMSGQNFKHRLIQTSIACFTVLFFLSMLCTVFATQPPRKKGGQKPSAEAMNRLQSFNFKHAYLEATSRIRKNRAAVRRGALTPAAAAAVGGLTISGTRAIPVLLGTFNNTPSNPYPNGNLQQELFDGPWPTGTMTDYYQEISYGQLNVTGTVFQWQQVSENGTHYEGGSGCNGLCLPGTGDFLQEVLDLNDPSVDFGQFDNDGPDGVSNSGDDDGFVDFVAFVHPEKGGECPNSPHIWSHRATYSDWFGGNDYETNDARNGGGHIRVDDYVIMPAFACDGSTMIQIGVFAHEFGHAFGLPDLYDTNDQNGDSEGIGGWGLMASGSWGGDNNHPETPAHMSAWSKEFLGWVSPTEITSDQMAANLPNIENNPVAFRLSIAPGEYYLIENRQQTGFDNSLTNSGLALWKINENVIDSGLANNSVNANENNQGVELVEADGFTHLDDNTNRGDAGDIFPGTADNRTFDNNSTPASSASGSVCQISDSADTMTANLNATMGNCDTNLTTPNVVGQSQSDAEVAIVAKGLTIGTVTTEHHPSVAKDNVIRQEPAAGTQATAGDAIDLVVSLGPNGQIPTPTIPITPPLTKGSISEAGMENLFEFHVTSQGSYTIETNGKTLSMDTVMSLFDSQNQTTPIHENDDIGSNNFNSRIVATLTPGTYHVKIRHFDSEQVGDYTIFVKAD